MNWARLQDTSSFTVTVDCDDTVVIKQAATAWKGNEGGKLEGSPTSVILFEMVRAGELSK